MANLGQRLPPGQELLNPCRLRFLKAWAVVITSPTLQYAGSSLKAVRICACMGGSTSRCSISLSLYFSKPHCALNFGHSLFIIVPAAAWGVGPLSLWSQLGSIGAALLAPSYCFTNRAGGTPSGLFLGRLRPSSRKWRMVKNRWVRCSSTKSLAKHQFSRKP